jgi:hypothetical protein
MAAAVLLDKAARLPSSVTSFEDSSLQITTSVRKRTRGVPNVICDDFLYG